MRPTGIILLAAAMLVPLYWFVPLFARYDTAAILSQYIASTAIIAMGISQLMATRLPFLETVFGGLDRIYILHKWLGVWAVCAVFLHDSVGAEIRGLASGTALSDFGEELGEVAYYGLVALAGISVATFIPYNLWRWTHKLIGIPFALSVVHFALIAKPFQTTDPLSLYILGFGVVGILSYLSALLPSRWHMRRHGYVVEKVEETGGALAVTLAPTGKGMGHRAGQFAFVRFQLPGLKEAHPFTISSASRNDRKLQFTIKPLGDYTSKLKSRVVAGTAVSVSGPFGHFAEQRGKHPEIWIAGGIGITPFKALAEAPGENHAPVHLFCGVKDRTQAPCLEALEDIRKARPDFHIHLFESEEGKRLSADAIVTATGDAFSKSTVYFCGPKTMRSALRSGLIAKGLKPSRFRYEEFELRTGIGLGRLASWILGIAGRAPSRPVRQSGWKKAFADVVRQSASR